MVCRHALTVPFMVRDMERPRMALAMLYTSSNVMLPACLTAGPSDVHHPSQHTHALFFSFLRSRGGSLSALITNDAAEGTTSMVACTHVTPVQ